MALQLLSILERDERQLYASSSLFVFCRLRKNSNYTAPRKSDTLISYFRAKLVRAERENMGRSAPYRSEKNVEYLEEHSN